MHDAAAARGYPLDSSGAGGPQPEPTLSMPHGSSTVNRFRVYSTTRRRYPLDSSGAGGPQPEPTLSMPHGSSTLNRFRVYSTTRRRVSTGLERSRRRPGGPQPEPAARRATREEVGPPAGPRADSDHATVAGPTPRGPAPSRRRVGRRRRRTAPPPRPLARVAARPCTDRDARATTQSNRWPDGGWMCGWVRQHCMFLNMQCRSTLHVEKSPVQISLRQRRSEIV
jgi:hypothetical protein